jgi:hypothetical protein
MKCSFPATGEGQPSSAPEGLVSLLVILTADAVGILTNRMSELLTSGTVGGGGRVTTGSTRHPTAARKRL